MAGEFEVLSLPGIELSGGWGQWLAINDVSMHRQQGKRVADLEYAVGRDEIGRVRCDGLVVATPAGSTGYNLANGGPVMAWGVDGFVVSFIAPHSLTARALVVAPDDVLVVHNRSREEPVDVTVDGRPVCVLAAGGADRGAVRRTARAALAQIAGTTFYQRLRQKFGRLADARRSARRRAGAAERTVRAADPSEAPGRPSRMLYELRVENLLLMERAELRLGPGPEHAHRARPAPARRCWRTRSTCCWAGARAAGSSAPAPPRRTSRACSRCPPGLEPGSRADSDGRRGDRARPARVARRPHPRVRLRPLRDRRPTCASSAAACSRSTGSTSTAS